MQVCSLYEKTSEIHSFVNEKYFRKILLMAASSYDEIDNSQKAQSLYTKITQDYEVEGLGISEFWVKSGIESFTEDEKFDLGMPYYGYYRLILDSVTNKISDDLYMTRNKKIHGKSMAMQMHVKPNQVLVFKRMRDI